MSVSGRPRRALERGDLVGQLGEHVPARVVAQLVHGVEPQRVDVEVGEPPQRVVDDPPAHLRAAGPSRLSAAPQGVWWASVK